MSLSSENYGIIGMKSKSLIEKIDLYISRYDPDRETIEPIVFIDEAEALIDEINQKKGEIGLGIKNLKTDKKLPKYLEMLDDLNLRLEQLRSLKRGKFLDTPGIPDILGTSGTLNVQNDPNDSGI